MGTYTVANIKDMLNRSGDQSGFAFDKLGPYFANAERLNAMKNRFMALLENDEYREVRRITNRAKNSIEDWFVFLADRYGI